MVRFRMLCSVVHTMAVSIVGLPEAVFVAIRASLSPRDWFAFANTARAVALRLAACELLFRIAKPVSISYDQLMSASTAAAGSNNAVDFHSLIHRSFGANCADSLGLLLVTACPSDEYTRRFEAITRAALTLHRQPAEWKHSALSNQQRCKAGAGWSCGADRRKENFRANPLHDVPTTNAALLERCAEWLSPNRWPPPSAGDGGWAAAFKSDFQSAGRFVHDIGVRVATEIDKYIATAATAPAPAAAAVASGRSIADCIATSRAHVSRLLFYGPPNATTPKPVPATATAADSKVAAPSKSSSELLEWHNDHGILTAVGPTRYVRVRTATGTATAATTDEMLSASPDQRAGIYVFTPQRAIVQVVIPNDAVCIQLGECADIWSGGVVRSRPHTVRGPIHVAGDRSGGLCHANMYYFMHPHPAAIMAPDRTTAATGAFATPIATAAVDGADVIPPLQTRWKCGESFAEFAATQHRHYK